MALNKTIERTKLQYILITFTILFISILVRLYHDKHQMEAVFNKQIEDMEHYTALLFASEIRNLESKYHTLTSHYSNTEEFQSLMRNRDRVALYKILKLDYFSLKSLNPHLYVMHILDKNNITILRMHKPLSYNDDLTNIRPIVRIVNEEKIKKSGFEVGKNGITYRITLPYITNKNEHLGVIEYGINPSYFVEKLQETMIVEAMVLIKTNALKPLINKVKRKKIDDYSIVSTSSLFEKIESMIDLKSAYQIIKVDNKSYLINKNLDLNSFLGEGVAKIVLASDITHFIERYEHNLYVGNSVSFFILFLIGGVIIYIFNIYTKKINILSQRASHFEEKAVTDNLTGLYNREYLTRHYEKITAYTNDEVCICVLFDIDYFKKVNDTYGHVVGDQVLSALSKLANEYFRKTDILIRYGGEEFILFVKNISYSTACTKIDNFRKYIESSNRFPQNIKITISVGVVIVNVNEELELLVDRADKLLYQAKEAGRNRVVFQEELK